MKNVQLSILPKIIIGKKDTNVIVVLPLTKLYEKFVKNTFKDDKPPAYLISHIPFGYNEIVIPKHISPAEYIYETTLQFRIRENASTDVFIPAGYDYKTNTVIRTNDSLNELSYSLTSVQVNDYYSYIRGRLGNPHNIIIVAINYKFFERKAS